MNKLLKKIVNIQAAWVEEVPYFIDDDVVLIQWQVNIARVRIWFERDKIYQIEIRDGYKLYLCHPNKPVPEVYTPDGRLRSNKEVLDIMIEIANKMIVQYQKQLLID